MRKKFFTILICGVMVLGLATGCKNDNKENNVSNKDNIEDKKVTISDVYNPYHGEDGGVALIRITETIDGEEKLNYYIADENGKLSSYNRKNTGDTISLNGYIIYNGYKNASHSSNYDGEIYDSKGKLVHTSSYNKQVFGDISENGNVIVLTTVDSLKGTSTKTELQDKDGNVIFSVNGTEDAEWLIDEIFFIKDDKGVNLIDASNKKNVHINIGYTNNLKASNGYIIVGQNIYDQNLNLISSTASASDVLNENYYLANDYDGAINKMADNTTIYSFKEGGVSQIFYYNDVYYVRSKTDFNYTLDKNFKYIAEPKKNLSGDLFLTSKGVVSNVEGYCILDEKLNCKTKIGYGSDTGRLTSSNGDYLYFTYKNNSYPNRIYNVKTESFMEFKK